MESKIKIVFFGTPEFAVESLDSLLKAGCDVEAVVTMPDKAAGRGHKLYQSDVKRYATEQGLKILQPEKLKSPEFLEELRNINADLFIVIAFRMLPREVWQMPRLGTFNLHASLLPKYRGAAPINRAVMNGETETGVTTFFLKHEIDTGDMIMQRKIEIGKDENVGIVHDRLMHLGASMVVETVRAIEEGTLTTIPQPEGEFTPAPKIFKEDCEIAWGVPSQRVHDQIRGLSPYPAAWTEIEEENGRVLECKIYESGLTDESVADNSAGTIKTDGKRMFVACEDNWLEILSLQPSGKKRMEASAFLLGYHPTRIKS